MNEASTKPPDEVKIQLTQFLSDNEPIVFSAEQVEECKRRFGNVAVAKAYLGVKIGSDTDLATYRALQETPSTVDVTVASTCFKWLENAIEDVMSYDDLAEAVKNGSTGRYGCAIVTLEPEPEQVIYKSWNDRGDGVKNPERKLLSSPNGEVLLSGSVKVTECIVFEKLTTSNWKAEIKKLVSIPEEISNSFLRNWTKDKLDSKEYYPFAKSLIKSLCTDESKTLECISELNSNESIIPFTEAASIHPIEDVLIKYLVFDKDSIRFQKDNIRLGVTHELIKKTFEKNYTFAIRGMKELMSEVGNIKLSIDTNDSELLINGNVDESIINNLFFLGQVLEIVPPQVRSRFFSSTFGKNMIRQSRDAIESIVDTKSDISYTLASIIGNNGELLEFTNDTNRYFKILANHFRGNRVVSSELNKIRG